MKMIVKKKKKGFVVLTMGFVIFFIFAVKLFFFNFFYKGFHINMMFIYLFYISLLCY